MRALILLALFLCWPIAATPTWTDGVYLTVGTGWKFAESEVWYTHDEQVETNHPISARIEVGKRIGQLTIGISHHSQPLTGRPFDDRDEYQKTELFIDYTWEF